MIRVELWLCVGALLLAAVAASAGRDTPRGVNTDGNHNNHHYYGDVIHNYNYKKNGDHDDEEEDHDDDGDKDHDDDHDHVWMFAIGDDFGMYEYIDEEGHARGFHIDLLSAVCKKAHKHCHYVLDRPHHCWDTEHGVEYPGIGLMDHWYDGCMGMLPSPERFNSFNFTLPFTRTIQAGFHYHKDREIADPTNITGLKIGMVEGWAENHGCVMRQKVLSGNKHGQYQMVHYDTHEEMVDGLKADKIDTFLAADVFESHDDSIEIKGPMFSCSSAGSSVMARYGNKMIFWWNDAFEQMVESGEYKQLCQDSIIDHGHRGQSFCFE